MLGNGRDPEAIQRHLPKLFAGIASLVVHSSAETSGASPSNSKAIAGVVSKEAETLSLPSAVPIETSTHVATWLNAVETGVRMALVKETEASLQGAPKLFPNSKAAPLNEQTLTQWLSSHPAQSLQLSVGILWTRVMEEALRGNDTADRLAAVGSASDGFLRALAACVLQKLPVLLRRNLEAMITVGVHQRDVTRAVMAIAKTLNMGIDHFEWQVRMR